MRQAISIEILIAASIVLGGVLAARLSSRIGVPALVLFLAAGFILGSDVTGVIYFDNATQAQLAGIVALVVILFEGGLHTPYRSVREVLPSAVSLATIGVAITATVTAVAAWYVLDLTFLQALLLGAIVGSTDAAAVFAVLRGQRMRRRLLRVLEAESGLNDPMAIFLTVTLLELITQDVAFSAPAVTVFFLLQMGGGIVLGYLWGRVLRHAMQHLRFEHAGFSSLFLLSAALVGYSLTTLLGASGFLAVYVSGVVVAGREFPYRQSVLQFQAGAAWLMQISMFVILGLFAFPRQVFELAVPAMVIACVLMFVARPIAVLLSLPGRRFSAREKAFISWAGLRGAVPIVLGTYPLIAGAQSAPPDLQRRGLRRGDLGRPPGNDGRPVWQVARTGPRKPNHRCHGCGAGRAEPPQRPGHAVHHHRPKPRRRSQHPGAVAA